MRNGMLKKKSTQKQTASDLKIYQLLQSNMPGLLSKTFQPLLLFHCILLPTSIFLESNFKFSDLLSKLYNTWQLPSEFLIFTNFLFQSPEKWINKLQV